MADELDVMLQGDTTPLASQAQIDGQENDSAQGNPAEQQTPEEIEFNSLPGSTQDRIKKLARDKRELSQRLETLERMSGQPNGFVPPAPNSNFTSPEEEAAIRTLSQKGLATKDDVRAELDERVNALRWEQEQNRLESMYTGSKGEPQYVREEVEDFIKSHPQYRGYAAEDVFRYKMFPTEFQNLELERRGTKTGRSQTLKPTSRASSEEQGITPEFIAERTDIKKYPDALEWQEEHRQQIDAVLARMQES